MEKKLYKKLEKINTEAAELRPRIEKLEKEKEELEEKLKQLKLDKEDEKEKKWNEKFEKLGMVVFDNRNETSKEIKIFEGMMVEQVTNLQNKVEKISTDSATANYEMQAIAIENKEKFMKNQEELEERVSQSVEQNKNEIMETMRQAVCTITEAISGLEERINQRLIPLYEKVEFIEKQMPKETILIFGTKDNETEMLILNDNKWTESILKCPKPFYCGGAVFLNGEIYIFGGRRMPKELHKLDTKTRKWIRLADMHESRWDITNRCLEFNGSIWVFGGSNGNSLKSVERYDPKKNEWIEVNDMKNPLQLAAAAVHNNKFIICGGYNDGAMASVECYDPESGVWTELNDMPSSTYGHSLVPFGVRLILIGADCKTAVFELSNLEEGGTWKELASTKYRQRYGTAAVLKREIYAMGGDTYMYKVEIFDGKSWTDGPSLPYSMSFISSFIIPGRLADILCDYS